MECYFISSIFFNLLMHGYVITHVYEHENAQLCPLARERDITDMDVYGDLKPGFFQRRKRYFYIEWCEC